MNNTRALAMAQQRKLSLVKNKKYCPAPPPPSFPLPKEKENSTSIRDRWNLSGVSDHCAYDCHLSPGGSWSHISNCLTVVLLSE